MTKCSRLSERSQGREDVIVSQAMRTFDRRKS